MANALSWLFGVLLLGGPPGAVAGLLLGARALSARDAPRVAVWVAYVLAAIVGAVTIAGYVGAAVVATGPVSNEGLGPSDKARALAEGISEALNCSAFALLVALVGGAWVGGWMWRGRGARVE